MSISRQYGLSGRKGDKAKSSKGTPAEKSGDRKKASGPPPAPAKAARPKRGPEFDAPLGKSSEPAAPVSKEGTPRPVGNPPGTTRLVFPCPAELAGRIDAYWHGEQLGSRSAAIRALIERGLK